LPNGCGRCSVGKEERLELEQQTRASYSGHKFDNGWGWLLSLYLEQKALGALGLTTPIENFDDRIIDGFMIISNKINALQSEEMKRGKK
jgi:hypothetical protein